MKWRLVDRLDGLSTWHKYDPVSKETTLYTVGDAEPGLEMAKELAKNTDYTNKGIKASWWHFCHIPNSILVKWHALGVPIHRPEELVKMVNKPEWKYLKVTSKHHEAKK